jgi:branched-chain amino acid transport system ATP-binding protein
MIALKLDRVERRFGALRAVSDITMQIAAGERRVVLGPNGAGKTTLFNLICGDFPPTAGKVLLFGVDITKLAPHQRARHGIGRTYQTSLLFNGLTVADNLCVALRGARSGRFSLKRISTDGADFKQVISLAEQVRLLHLMDRQVDELSHGQRRQLEVGMAMACQPKLLMLDEPAAGLSPAERPELIKMLKSLPRELTLILIEHDMDVALPMADLVTVMKDGVVMVEETPDRIVDHPIVREIYLGKKAT